MGYMDIDKARKGMTARKLDALLAAAPMNVRYITGFGSLMGEMWYEAGLPTAWCLVPGAATDPAMVVAENEAAAARTISGIEDVRGYPVWVDIDSVSDEGARASDIAAVLRAAPSGRGKPAQRPGFFDTEALLEALTDVLKTRGLLGARIGADLHFISQGAFVRLQAALPRVQFVDAGPLLSDLRSVKTRQEIAHLRAAVSLAERGIVAAVTNVTDATRHADIRLRFEQGAAHAAMSRGVFGFKAGAVSARVGPRPWTNSPDATLRSGDQIMFDCATEVQGLHYDIGRTFVYGRATAAQRRIQSALVRAHDAALEMVRPGNRLCDVYRAGMDAMHAAGFDTYRRGHLGHSIGFDPLEEAPMINMATRRVMEPGMVLAVELPWYIDGIGGFQCENDILVTETGFEDLTTLTRDLATV